MGLAAPAPGVACPICVTSVEGVVLYPPKNLSTGSSPPVGLATGTALGPGTAACC